MSYETAKKSRLTKILNLFIPCKKLGYADYLVNLEPFFRDIRNLDILYNQNLDFIKVKTKEVALSSYKTYYNIVPQNLSHNLFHCFTKPLLK